jgi:hypothetical protein
MWRTLTVGLLALVLTAGCYQNQCEIACADGFRATLADECDPEVTVSFAQSHGGTCSSEDKKDYWPFF